VSDNRKRIIFIVFSHSNSWVSNYMFTRSSPHIPILDVQHVYSKLLLLPPQAPQGDHP
jgi:hypothetical protein